MKSLGERLVNKIEEISNVEVSILKLSSAIYVRSVEEKIANGINDIKSNFIGIATGYGISESVYSGQLNKIIDGFNSEISKIKDEYEIQFVNLQLEIQEAMANQQIALVNAKKVVDLKEEFKESEKYAAYMKSRKDLETHLSNSLSKVEYDKYSKLLEELSDPLDVYNFKRDASLNKYYDYNKLISDCESKLDESLNLVLSEIDRIIGLTVEKALIVRKENPISKFINKIKNIFSGKSNYEKKVKTYETVISTLSEESGSKIESIRNNTIDFLAEIKVSKDNINSKQSA